MKSGVNTSNMQVLIASYSKAFMVGLGQIGIGAAMEGI